MLSLLLLLVRVFLGLEVPTSRVKLNRQRLQASVAERYLCFWRWACLCTLFNPGVLVPRPALLFRLGSSSSHLSSWHGRLQPHLHHSARRQVAQRHRHRHHSQENLLVMNPPLLANLILAVFLVRVLIVGSDGKAPKP